MQPIRTYYDKELLLFHQATQIPLCVFDNTPKDILRYPMMKTMNCSFQTMSQCITALNKTPVDRHFPLLYSSDTCFYALLKLDDDKNIMFGPVSSVPITYKEFFNSDKSIRDLPDLLHLYRIIQQSPLFSLTKFAASISLFIKLLFQEDISVEDILENQMQFPPNKTEPAEILPSESSYMTMHDIMNFQKKTLYHIRNGNRNAIEDLFRNAYIFDSPEKIPSTTDELKKVFFIYATLCYMAVIEEGLELQKAFPIFDNYISKISSIASFEHLTTLCKQISLDYCSLIIPLHNSKSDSPVVTKCLQYIQSHLYGKITVNDLATHCNMSRRTITRHFTEFYHMPVAEYIIRLKLKEAAFLLTHSHYSLAEISNQLAFSSQSHFSVTFKKMYQYTPQQYRDKFKT